jgi:hypothetical protein
VPRISCHFSSLLIATRPLMIVREEGVIDHIRTPRYQLK